MLRGITGAAALGMLIAATLVSASPGQGPPGGSPPGLERALAAKQRHAERLLDLPGVAGVAVALNAAGRPIVRIYKERPDVADLPERLDGVDVDSRVTGRIEPYDHAPTHRYPRPVPIGVSAGLSGVATGTLGARVTDGTNVYALSNNHVFAGVDTANLGDPIISPGDADGGSDPADRIGTLAAAQTIDFDGGPNTMDAAIALTSTANVGTSTPDYGYGTPSTVTTEATLGLPVQKVGRTTGFQLGEVAGTNVSVDVCYALLFDFCLMEARFVGQVSVTPGTFAAPGDSGSLIVTQGGNQPVALLFAGGDGLAIGNPIDLVLQRFGVTIDGAPPGDSPPGAPTAVSAYSGDGSATLAWNAPTFDGGSPVTQYRVYRGTASGQLAFHAAVATTSFDDDGVTNGTTYYYAVSAVNEFGEGALSTEVSANPTALVPPVEPLPVVDGFDRPDENPLSDAGRWTNGVNGSVETGLLTSGGTLACSKTTTCTAWRNATQYGPDVEVSARISTLLGTDNHIRLLARLQGVGAAAYDGYMLRTNELSGVDRIWLERIDDGAFVKLLTLNQELAAGDLLLLRIEGSRLEVWHRSASGWSRLGVAKDATYASPGYTGIGVRGTTGRLDDFAVNGISQAPPGTPAGLAATAGDASATLTWSPPSFDGGSPITGYRVYRGVPPEPESFLEAVGNVTTFADAGLTNGTTYSYRVSAVNANGEGALSSAVSTVPTGIEPPLEPLPTLDTFDRAAESPLSDGGRWSNGVIGSVETGLYTTANTLACSRSTTCTAWRNAVQYGPDTEVWTKVTTLAGDGNHIRLYARLREVGGSGYDGYMLRTNQLAGTDEIYLERVDNSGTFVKRLTIQQELAAGDVLLLRVRGATLEAWHHDGAAWARLGAATDTTYAEAGYAGVGLRGTTGRLDDLGVRTYGVEPQPPTAPTGLVATPSDGLVRLSWQPSADNGGSAITGYRVYRGTAPGEGTLLQTLGPVTSHDDAAVANGTTYHYTVRAVNGVGESEPSNEASATPSDLVPPVEPLPVVDSFNRANEKPLSDAGRWGDGINGAGERSMRVVSQQLASDRSTTTTAWRKNQLYGPDVETWITVRTMPGNGNWLRLYARLQQPGSSAHDGYMLVATQQSGVDQWTLVQVTNYTWTTIATGARDFAVGNRVLLRAVGTTIEAWLQSGTTWVRVLRATDSTYTSSGYVGVGLRGTTGRLDDFGAR